MNTPHQVTVLLSTSTRNRDNLIFEFSQLNSQLRKIKTDIRKGTAAERDPAFDLALPALKRL